MPRRGCSILLMYAEALEAVAAVEQLIVVDIASVVAAVVVAA